MRKRITYISLFFLFSVSAALSQDRVQLFADVKDNDTLQKLITEFSVQLKKSQVKNIEVLPLASYSGMGIYISNSKTVKAGAKPPSKLLTAGPEAFSISGTDKKIQIFSNSNIGLGHALFAYLESLGYRFYFAHPDWHIIPEKINLYKKQEIFTKPDLDHRRIVYGYGTGSAKADKDFVFWQLANRMGGTLNAIYGHSYDEIMIRNKEEFKKHPEWLYPQPAKGTLPTSEPKFNMAEEGLVQIVIQDVIKQIELSLKNKTQDYKMITLGPSDGLGTCNTPACQKLGTITDRVFYLVNRVAKAIQKKYPTTKIGCLAYSEYIAPPSGKVEPNVYVAITTAFNNSKYSTVQLIEEWKKKGVVVGLYDYFSWYAWDYDVPGQSLASQPYKIAESIRKYQKLGLKGYDAESSIGWVSKGLGYYIAAKTMWDVKTEIGGIRKEFFEKSFGKAASTIEKLWDEWERYGFTLVRENDLARWIDLVKEADKQETNTLVQKRFFQIKSYLHYLFLYRQYQMNKNEATMLNLLSYGFRMLDDGSVSGYPAFFELGNRSGIAGMSWGPDAKWRSNKGGVSEAEMNNFLTQDRSKLKLAEEVKKFRVSKAFINVPLLSKYSALINDSADIDNKFWLTNEWIVQIKSKGKGSYIDFTGDFIADKNTIQPIRIKVYPHSPSGDVGALKPVFSYDYTATQIKERISLEKLPVGLYTMLIEDPVKIYRLTFSPQISHSVVMRPSRHIQSTSINYAFIYVPEGVNKFNVIKSRVVKFITPTGRKVDLVNDKEEDIQVNVMKGEAGLWRIKLLADRLYIEGIPPYLSVSPLQMLIPDNSND